MLGFVSRIVGERGRPPGDTDDADGADGSDDSEPGDRRPATNLYECPDCESVYLSAELSTCRSCDSAVEPVPTEQDLGYGPARNE